MTFMDDPETEDIAGDDGIPIPFTAKTYKVCLVQQHGWVMGNPEASKLFWFMNMASSEFFEDLGEL